MTEPTHQPPLKLIAGTTVEWLIRADDYPAPTWTGELALVMDSDAQQIATTDNGNGEHLVRLDPAVSALLQRGIYRWQVTLTDGTDRHPVQTGVLEVIADYAAINGGLDDRSDNAKLYDAITAVMLGKASSDQSSMAIGGRSLSRYTWDELSQMRGAFAHQMTDSERMARGFSPSTPPQVRFVRHG